MVTRAVEISIRSRMRRQQWATSDPMALTEKLKVRKSLYGNISNMLDVKCDFLTECMFLHDPLNIPMCALHAWTSLPMKVGNA